MELEVLSLDKDKKRAVVKMRWRGYSIKFDIHLTSREVVEQGNLFTKSEIKTVWEFHKLTGSVKWLCDDRAEFNTGWPLESEIRSKINEYLCSNQG